MKTCNKIRKMFYLALSHKGLKKFQIISYSWTFNTKTILCYCLFFRGQYHHAGLRFLSLQLMMQIINADDRNGHRLLDRPFSVVCFAVFFLFPSTYVINKIFYIYNSKTCFGKLYCTYLRQVEVLLQDTRRIFNFWSAPFSGGKKYDWILKIWEDFIHWELLC